MLKKMFLILGYPMVSQFEETSMADMCASRTAEAL
jgi:hypothetical protein